MLHERVDELVVEGARVECPLVTAKVDFGVHVRIEEVSRDLTEVAIHGHGRQIGLPLPLGRSRRVHLFDPASVLDHFLRDADYSSENA